MHFFCLRILFNNNSNRNEKPCALCLAKCSANKSELHWIWLIKQYTLHVAASDHHHQQNSSPEVVKWNLCVGGDELGNDAGDKYVSQSVRMQLIW